MNARKPVSVCILLILVFALGFVVGMRDGPRHEFYPRVGTVCAFDTENDVVIVEDLVGILWGIEGIEDLEIGDRIAMVMDDNGTMEVYDDIICTIRYIG